MSSTTHCCYSFLFLILALSYLPRSSLVRAELFFGNFDTNSNPVYIGVAFAALTFLFALSFIGFHFCCRTTPDTSIRAWSGSPGHGGLDPSLLLGFPVFTYSDVEGHRPDDGPLECAVCLGEFEAAETLRLLPKCNHVFHVGCVDTWLSAHATCPLCRTNLVPEPDVPAPGNEGRVSGLGGPAREVVNDHVVVEVRQNAEEGHFRKFRRWSSTGHIANNFERVEDSWERHTLRLPEEVTRDIIIARKINRSNSCRQFCIKVV